MVITKKRAEAWFQLSFLWCELNSLLELTTNQLSPKDSHLYSRNVHSLIFADDAILAQDFNRVTFWCRVAAMLNKRAKNTSDIDVLVDPPLLQQVTPPVLPRFRRLQLFAIVLALLWVCAGLLVSQQLIHTAQNNRLNSLYTFGSSETDYIAGALEQHFNQAEQLAATLSLQENIVARIGDINTLSAGLNSLDATARYAKLTADSHAHSLNVYLTRLASALNIPRLYLLDKNGLCVVSSQWTNPHACVGGNYQERAYYRKAITDGSGMQFAVGIQINDPSFFFSSAIKYQDEFLGAAIVRLNSDELEHFFARDSGLSMVIDNYGMIVVSTEERLLLNHVGDDFGTAPTAEQLARIYAVNTLQVANVTKIIGHNFDVDLWRYKNTDNLMFSAQIGDRDLRVIRFVPVPQLAEISSSYWIMALAAIAFGVMLIVFVERNINFAAHRKAHLAALASANSSLNEIAHKLYDLAINDSLTGLRNHRFFMRKLDEEIERAHATNNPMALIFIDIDLFKKINDTYGHPVGDEVICNLAHSFAGLVRACDTVGRLGGEEFAILLPDANLHHAVEIAERIQHWCQEQNLQINGHSIRFTCSFGVSALASGWDAKALLNAVDGALYRAKAKGRNCVVASEESV
jgi:diguanylate cyclase (GGDEF)-like protein